MLPTAKKTPENKIKDKNKIIGLRLNIFVLYSLEKALKLCIFLKKLFSFWINVIVVFLQKISAVCNEMSLKKPSFIKYFSQYTS